MQHAFGRELAIAEAAAVRRLDHAIRGREPIGRDAQALRRLVDEDAARFGRREPHGRPAVFDRLAARREALVRRRPRIARDHAHAREREAELLGGDLGKGGQDALAELDLAGHHRDRAVGIDAEPGVEHGVAGQGCPARRWPPRTECQARGASAKATVRPRLALAKRRGG